MTRVMEWISVAICVMTIGLAESLQCLKCENVISPLLCSGKVTCDINEACFIDKFKGNDDEVVFNLGCRLNSKCNNQGGVDICTGCCSSDLCNYRGCGETGRANGQGPVCLSCNQIRDPTKCDTIQICDQGEKCHIEEKNQFGLHFYSTACMSEHQCRHFLSPTDIFGRRSAVERSSQVTCAACCDGNLCNSECPTTDSTTTRQIRSTTTATTTSAQTTTVLMTTPIPNGDHMGNEFYLMTFKDYSGADSVELIITTEDTANVKIESPYPGVNRTVLVTNSVGHVRLPPDIDNISSSGKYCRGIYISSDRPISVAVVTFFICCAANGLNVIPVKFLSREYSIATTNIGYDSSFSVLATHDKTFVTVSSDSASFNLMGQTVSPSRNVNFTLNKLQYYFYVGSYLDLSGVRISADRNVAAFSGTMKLKSPRDEDAIVANMPPIERWGRNFIIPLIQGYKLTLKILSSTTVNSVNIAGKNGYSTTVTSFPSSLYLSVQPYVVTAERPILATVITDMYNYSINPYMVVVPAVTQYSNNYIISIPAFSTQYDSRHYIAVAIQEAYFDGLLLNKKPLNTIAENKIALKGQQYKIAVVNFSGVDAHTLEHIYPNTLFCAIVYGNIRHSGYGYPAGLRL